MFTCGWYQKPTDTGTILIFRGCAPLQYKRNVIEETVHSVFRSTSLWENFDQALEKNRKQWIENQYPKNWSDNIVFETLNKIIEGQRIFEGKAPELINDKWLKNSPPFHNAMLAAKLWQISGARIIFTTRKLKTCLPSLETSFAREVRSKVVYKLTCNEYIDEHRKGISTNMLSFLKEIYEALDNDSNAEIVAVYTDFAKAFDKVPHFDLLKKVALIGIGGCMLEVLYDYLKNRKQFVRVDNISSKVLEVTSGVPQGSLLGTLLFCIFINDLPEVLKFSEPYIFADDLKLLSIKKTSIEIQEDLDKIQQWVTENKMELALDKCAKVSLRGGDANSMLFGVVLGTSMVVKDLGIFVSGDLSWKVHIETRLKKANQVLYLLRRNLSAKLNTFVKLGLYKSLILPVLLYGLSCTHISRGDQLQLERFQKKVIRWITGNKTGVYINELRLLNILPLPMFIQLNNILLLASLDSNERNEIVLNRRTTRARNTEIFEMRKVRTEKARNEFVFRTSRIVNRLEPYIHFDKREFSRPQDENFKHDVEICKREIFRNDNVQVAIIL